LGRLPVVALVLALVLGVLGCADPVPGTPGPPSDGEARAYLDRVVDLVLGERLNELCRTGSGTCERTLSRADPATVPTTRPVVLGTRILPAWRGDGSSVVGGRIIDLCGIDGRGNVYRSEILVFRDADRIIGKEPVFWIGLRIASGPLARAPGPVPPGCQVVD